MRHRSIPHVATTVALLAVTLGAASPPAAAAAAVPAAVPPSATSPSAAPRSASPPSASPPSAAPAAEDAAGGRLGIDVAVSRDGNGPFTPADGPGSDAGPSNGVVRTLDAVTYRVTVGSDDGPGHDTRFTVSAPAGTTWDGVPKPCSGSGSGITGQDLTCDLGTLAEGQVTAVPVVLDVSDMRHDGDRLAVRASVSADGTDGPTATSPAVTVSAAPRYDLSKSLVGSQLRTGVQGPGGRRGLQFVYPVTVDWRPVVPGQGLLGFERSTGTMSFTDDVSRILGDLPADAVLWNGDGPACGPNEPDSPVRFGNLPGGSGGGPSAVADSGAFRCEQSAPGGDVRVTVEGVVTDASRMPTQTLSGGPVPGGVRGMVVSGYVSFWVPSPPAGTSVLSENTYSALEATSVSGAPDYPGTGEPTADNTAWRNVYQGGPGTASKRLYRVTDDEGHVAPGSAQEGDPWTTPGQRHRSDVSMANPGLTPFHDAVLCDTFDRRTQRLTAVGGRSASTTGLAGARVQYAAYAMTSPEEGQRHADCSDAAGPWFDDPADVPGGVAAVGAVRAVGDVAALGDATLQSFVSIRQVPDGTRVYDFGHVVFGDRYPEWVHDVSSDPELGAGGLSDSALVTEDIARIAKKVVDPGHDAADTPDDTRSVLAGDTLDYAVYPTVTNGNAEGEEVPVSVTDVLPPDTAYVAGSASRTPEVDTVTDDDGTRHERLTWDLGRVVPNRPIAPITYSVRVAATAAAAAVTNHAVVASPADASPEGLRGAERAVRVVAGGGVGVEKTAVDPVVVSGDHLEWDLRYRNTDASSVPGTDLIDVLPRSGASGSSFHGSVRLAAGVAPSPSGQERVTYTASAPETVDLDGGAASNRPGGSTTWCAESDFGASGCPASFADATAVRVQREAALAPGEVVSHRVTLVTDGQRDDDRYVNRFGLRAAGLALPVRSNSATIRVVSGAIGDLVWDDEDLDGLQDDGEPGVPDVSVRLRGTDDHDDPVERATDTDHDGQYHFDGLRPGSYTVTFTAPADTTFTHEHVGDDPARDSDADADGSTGAVVLPELVDAEGRRTGVERTTSIDAGLVRSGTEVPGGVGPGGGTGGGTDDGSGHAGAPVGGAASSADHGTRPRNEALAFTGAAGLLAPSALAVLALLAGVVLRRRSRRP